MRLAFAIMFLWVGAGCLYLASRGLEAASPWAAFQTILSRIEGSDGG